MNPPDLNAEERAKRLAELLEKPALLPDPVFPQDEYLEVLGRSCFQTLLKELKKPELIPQITSSGSDRRMVMLRTGWVAFWAIDFEEKSEQGVSGRDAFVDRIKDPIRRPPPEMAAFTLEQHLLAYGIVRIQIKEGPAVPGQYEIVRLKTIGWYAAQLVSPKS